MSELNGHQKTNFPGPQASEHKNHDFYGSGAGFISQHGPGISILMLE